MAMNDGYGRRLLNPRALFAYVFLGIIAYALVVYILARNSGRMVLPGGPPVTGSTKMTVPLSALNGSNENGTAVIEAENGGAQTKVTVTLVNEPSGAIQPDHIHLGSCPNPGSVQFPLSDVVNGQSETTLNVAYNNLVAMIAAGPMAVNVHQSASQIQTYVSCGDIQP